MNKLSLELKQLEDLSNGLLSASQKVTSIRDLTLIELVGGISIVIACDSNASNGEKPNDFHNNSYEESAVSVLKVPMMEVLATGAIPILVVDNLCMELEPTGRRIINIIKKELSSSLPDYEIFLTGSTEDNFPTTQSGFGITVIGILHPGRNRLRSSLIGDYVFCVGIPQSGIEVPYFENTPSVAGIDTVFALSRLDSIHEILPIGSKGALFEANQLADTVGAAFEPIPQNRVDLKTSAGSSTAVLISTPLADLDYLDFCLKKPITMIGQIIR